MGSVAELIDYGTCVNAFHASFLGVATVEAFELALAYRAAAGAAIPGTVIAGILNDRAWPGTGLIPVSASAFFA